MKKSVTPFSKIVGVVNEGGVWKIELNIPYIPSLFTCNRDFYSESEARIAAIHIEAKLMRLVRIWMEKKG